MNRRKFIAWLGLLFGGTIPASHTRSSESCKHYLVGDSVLFRGWWSKVGYLIYSSEGNCIGYGITQNGLLGEEIAISDPRLQPTGVV